MTQDFVGSYQKTEDTGTTEQRQQYISLLDKLSAIFGLEGLPSDRNTLFDDYHLPPDIPLLEALTRHEMRFPTSRGHVGCANVLYNPDFTLILGRVSSNRSDYGYMVMLLRNDNEALYTTVNQTAERKAYRYSHWRFLNDLQELIIAAFCDDRVRLEKYRENNAEIATYLDRGYVQRSGRFATTRFKVHICTACKMPYFSSETGDGDLCIPCSERAFEDGEAAFMDYMQQLAEYPTASFSDGVFVYDEDGEILGPV